MEQVVFDKKVLLERFPGKGGWTYAKLPGLPGSKWQKLRGTIEGHAVEVFGIMPFGNGVHFTPVKAEIRKIIGKEAGDMVHICLFGEVQQEFDLRLEFMACLADDPNALKNFSGWAKEIQEREIQWIESATSLELKIERMAQAVRRIGENIPMKSK